MKLLQPGRYCSGMQQRELGRCADAESRKHAQESPMFFLDLPVGIRYRIYRDAGLETDYHIKLRTILTGIDGFYRSPFVLQHYLRSTSRAINNDVTGFLLFNNSISVSHTDFWIFDVLNKSLISSFSRLSLILHLRSAHNGPCGFPQHDDPEIYGEHYPAFEKLLKEYRISSGPSAERGIMSLVSHSNPSALKLKLTCDVEEVDVARQLLAPLRRLRVRSCVIRFGEDIDGRLQLLARGAVFEMLGSVPHDDQIPLQFLQFPPEIRLYILEYTDLVMPLLGVSWQKDVGYLPGTFSRYCVHERKEYDIEPHHGMPGEVHLPECMWSGSFCSRYHTIFPHCGCWQRPTALFLVCKSFRQDALSVFFRRNRFDIDRTAANRLPRRSSANLPISIFLRNVVPTDALRHLRHLHIWFPVFMTGVSRLEDAAYEDWQQTLTYVKPHLCLSALALCIWVKDAPSLSLGPVWNQMMFDKQNMSVQGVQDLEMYERIFEPLGQLAGLEYFAVYAIEQETYVYNDTTWPALMHNFAHLELYLRRLVVGPPGDHEGCSSCVDLEGE